MGQLCARAEPGQDREGWRGQREGQVAIDGEAEVAHGSAVLKREC